MVLAGSSQFDQKLSIRAANVNTQSWPEALKAQESFSRCCSVGSPESLKAATGQNCGQTSAEEKLRVRGKAASRSDEYFFHANIPVPKLPYDLCRGQ